MDDPKVCDEMASAWDEHACDLLRAAGRAMRPEVSAGGFRDGPWKSVYATCFGLGLLVMVVVLLLGHARAADGAKVSGFELLAGLGVRSFLFVPAMTALPAAVALAWGLADSMAGSFEAEAGSTLFDVMYAELLEYVGGLGLQIVTGLGLFSIDNVIAALVTGVCLLVSWVLIQLELIVATFGVYLITCLAPLGIALSLYPAQRGVAKAILSALAGVVLIKPALWLVLWVGSVTVLDQVGSPEAGDWRASVSLIVLSLTAAAAPALAPKVLSKLVGPGVDAAWGREGLGAAWGVVKGAGREGFHDVKQYLRTRDEPRAADDATGGGGEAGGAPARAADGPAETVGPVPEPAGGVSPVAVPAGGARGAGGPPGVPVGGAGGAGAAPGAG
ncbi:MAG: type IV secretion system protein, partial [Propionibacteriaceae bacterium]|nr:type IV secretion system protein [Propionibacteriaceae bacterium]